MLGIVLSLLYFGLALMIAVLVHEAGHTISALLCGVKVETFSIGFGKAIWTKKIGGINFKVTPFLLGGYTRLKGEISKVPNGFMAQRYIKKVIILLSGVFMNFLLACLCYKLNYGSILQGFSIDWQLLKAILSKDTITQTLIILEHTPNLFLLQLSVINFACLVFNLLPFPALDGGTIWVVLLEKKIKNFEAFLKRVFAYGFMFLMVLQFILIVYILWR